MHNYRDRHTGRQTDRHTDIPNKDRHTGRQTDIQTSLTETDTQADRQTDIQTSLTETDTQADRQTDRQTDNPSREWLHAVWWQEESGASTMLLTSGYRVQHTRVVLLSYFLSHTHTTSHTYTVQYFCRF